jgi:hypothetical protein
LFYCSAFIQAFSFCSVLYFLTKKTRQYFSQVGIVFRHTRGVYVGIMVAVSILLLSVQVLGVPLWWAFGTSNPYSRGYSVYLKPQSPKIGENITIHVTNYGSYKTYSWYNNVSNAMVTITANGMEPYTVYTDENGLASFVYDTQPTVVNVRCYSFSQFYVIPATPKQWEISFALAISIAILFGLLAGFKAYKLKDFASNSSRKRLDVFK